MYGNSLNVCSGRFIDYIHDEEGIGKNEFSKVLSFHEISDHLPGEDRKKQASNREIL